MSEPKTAAEIEDILSSIRRLVSHDRKPDTPRPHIVAAEPAPPPFAAPPASARQVEAPVERLAEVSPIAAAQLAAEASSPAAPRPVAEGPLLLTPALRVKSPRREAAEAAVVPPTSPVEDVLPAAATSAAVTPAVPPAAATPPSLISPPPILPAPVFAAKAPQAVDPLPGALVLRPHAAEPSASARLHLGRSTATLAKIEMPDPLAWEAEMGDPAPDLSSLAWAGLAEPAPEPKPDLKPERKPEPVALTEQALPEAKPVLEAEAPALPTGAPVDEALAAEPVARQQEEDSIFSEDVLRELVRDLIKEQLQGELGERITRNIRKLVKAEIARSSSLQHLE